MAWLAVAPVLLLAFAGCFNPDAYPRERTGDWREPGVYARFPEAVDGFNIRTSCNPQGRALPFEVTSLEQRWGPHAFELDRVSSGAMGLSMGADGPVVRLASPTTPPNRTAFEAGARAFLDNVTSANETQVSAWMDDLFAGTGQAGLGDSVNTTLRLEDLYQGLAEGPGITEAWAYDSHSYLNLSSGEWRFFLVLCNKTASRYVDGASVLLWVNADDWVEFSRADQNRHRHLSNGQLRELLERTFSELGLGAPSHFPGTFHRYN